MCACLRGNVFGATKQDRASQLASSVTAGACKQGTYEVTKRHLLLAASFPVESGQAILLPDREICQITVLVGRPVVTWPMVQGRLRKTVQCDGRKVRAGVSKRQREAVMKAGMQAFPIAAVRDEGKDTKVEFFAPPKQSDGRPQCVPSQPADGLLPSHR